jgi:UDPglucose 6-dehydrogenase
VRAHDPEAMEQAGKQLNNVTWCKDLYNVAEGADAVVILTEWNQYRMLDFKRLTQAMRGKAFLDLRNVYKRDELADTGLEYYPLGKG